MYCPPNNEDKQDLLGQFVLTGENMNAIESQLHVSRDHENEVARTRELLTIKEMREKGFSQHLDSVCVSNICIYIPIM